MSGWWLASSASSATRLTKSIAAAKSSNFRSRTIAGCPLSCAPVLRHSPALARRSSISASLSGGDIASASLPRRGGDLTERLKSLPVRIVSLVPHATELLFALGLEGQVVGVTHECDYPPAALEAERVTRDVLPAGLRAGEIDAAVRERTLQGEAIYELD